MSYAVGLKLKPARKYSKYFWYLIWALDIALVVLIYCKPDVIVMGFN